MESWDPIGVRDFPEAQDEYDGYVGKVYVMLMDDRASSQAIAAYLYDIAISYIGITPGPELKARSTHAGSLVVSIRASFETRCQWGVPDDPRLNNKGYSQPVRNRSTLPTGKGVRHSVYTGDTHGRTLSG
jgi:hypothetical protein